MNPKFKIYAVLAVAGIVALIAAGGWLRSRIEIRSHEKTVNEAKKKSELSEQAAVEAETRAAEYMEKIKFLEEGLGKLQTIARKQDEELEKISADVGGARVDVDRARRVRTITTTAEELCRKLGELGHGCE